MESEFGGKNPASDGWSYALQTFELFDSGTAILNL
jgi:hypothetical protein